MRVLKVLIDRDAVQKTACEKWAADLPVLRAMYGEDQVVVTGFYDADVEERSPQEEFERLRKTYGEKPKAGMSWAEYCYGRSNDAITRAMRGEDLDLGEFAKPVDAPKATTSEPKKKAAKKTASK